MDTREMGVSEPTLWEKIKCFFGYHLWLEEWLDDWPMVEDYEPFRLPTHIPRPRMETPEDHEKKGWTRKCLNCGKVQKREEWT